MKNKLPYLKIKFVFAVVLIIAAFNSVGFAQSIYFAQSYTTSGKAINAKNSWVIPATGKSIFILFNAEDAKIKGDMVYLYIDKFDGRKYKPYNTLSAVISPEKRWFVHREKFTEAGKYKIYVTDARNRVLASGVLRIKVKAPKFIDTQKQSAPYYKRVRMTFSEWVIGGKPFHEMKVKHLSKKPDSVCVYLKHPDSLNTPIIYADFYKYNDWANRWELIDSKEYAILPMWDYIFFKYYFPEKGLYKVEVFDEKRQFIKSAYLKVEE